MAELFVKMFGNPSIWVDGRVVTFSYRKADALLYYLIIRKKVARNELAELLWGGSDATAALKNLRHAIYTIRKGLGFDVFTSSQLTMLELNSEASLRCDVVDFLEKGSLPDPWGEFLEGFAVQHSSLFEDWLSQQRNLLHIQYLKRLLADEKDAFHGGDLELAEQLGIKYVQLDPLEESAAVVLMEIYSGQKKFRKAIGVYHELCKNLSAELSISPLKETTALYYRIVNEWNSSTYKMEEQSYHLLVGKDHALRHLLAMCNGPTTDRRMPCALIEGEAGVGKTYLLDHILTHYDFSDWLVCRSFCYLSEAHVPLASWNSIMMSLMSEMELRQFSIPENYLKAASGLFPCLSVSVEQSFTAAEWNCPLPQNYHIAQESALLILTIVAKRFPILLVFEDIHWMDKSSVDLLAIFLRRMRNLNVTVICTSRDICPTHVKAFIDSARRDSIMECYPIHRFNREETDRFIGHYLSKEPSAALQEQLFKSTGGNALLLIQLMNTLRERPDLPDFSDSLENIIEYRLTNLTLEERQVLNLISVFPDWATFESLSSILTKDTLELMYLCGQLKQRMLVQESNRDGTLHYSLAYDQLQATVLKQLPEAARRILHLRVAQYLETQLEHTRGLLYDRLVYHYQEGENQFKAFQYRVLSLNAYTGMHYVVLPTLIEASDDSTPQDMSCYFSTLDQGLSAQRLEGSNAQTLDQLEMILLHAKSCYCIYVGQYPEGLDALGRLLPLCATTGNHILLVRTHLQFIYYGIQTWNVAVIEAHLQLGIELLAGREQSEEYGIYLRMQGLLLSMQGEHAQARAVFQRSIDIFHRLSPGHGHRYAINIAGAYNYIAESYRLEQDYEQAFLAYDQAIIYNRSHSRYPGAAVFYTNYGVAAFHSNEKEIAYQLFLYALETYRVSHEYSGRPIALSYLAFFAFEQGELSTAVAYLNEAFQVSEMIGSPWWMGVTLYQCWKIREAMAAKGVQCAELSALWPASQLEHLRLCLSFLQQIQPQQITTEVQQALAALSEIASN